MECLQVISLRKKYVPAYVRCLQENKQGGDADIEAMDAELPEQTIIVYRRLAHAQVIQLPITVIGRRNQREYK